MKRFSAGTTGAATSSVLSKQKVVRIPREWKPIVDACTKGRPLRPVQGKALLQFRMLDSRRHMVVCAPTNSGKSLIGHLALFEALLAGKRAVLLEPLRSLAQEKADELTELLLTLSASLRKVNLCLTTGDYRLENSTFHDPAPDRGEMVIATPERFEAILRNPANQAWVDSIGCVVVDEAHLIGSPRRGPTLELLIATLLSSKLPPRLILLTATAGQPERLSEWLKPCDLVQENCRTPPLCTDVWSLEEAEDIDTVLSQSISETLSDPCASVLIFVYKRASANALAAFVRKSLSIPADAYHSGLTAEQRGEIRHRFSDGRLRCVVTTSALAMGVNLPATHVFVRDTTFFGHGALGTDEILQMVGRAGRGDRDGHAVVMLRASDTWTGLELANALRTQDLPPLRSAFDPAFTKRTFPGQEDDSGVAAQAIASCLSRCGDKGLSLADLNLILANSLAGPALTRRIEPALRWLEDPARVLAYCAEDQNHHLTVLGLRGVRSVLPLGYVSGLGQLVRDLMWLDPTDRMLSQWSALDHLLVMTLLSDRSPGLRRFSSKLAEQIDGWHESRIHLDKSLLFREWIHGAEGSSRSDELFGSLGLCSNHRDKMASSHHKNSYLAMLGAILLDERSRGVPVVDLERRWGITGLEGMQESWRDTALWLLAGQAQIFELRTFYHHLVEHCEADRERVQRVKKQLRIIRHQTFDLMERIKYCSALGPLMRGVRGMLSSSSTQSVGPGTIKRLEEAGLHTFADVAALDVEAMVGLGVQRRYAKQIRAYVRRRLR